jgi:hypothetical protein
MKTYHSSTGNKLQSENTFEGAAPKQNNKSITLQSKRSTHMKANKSLSNIWRSITVTLLISLFTTLSFGQNIVIQSGSNFTGSGIINVKGNINTTSAGGAVSFPGTVVLNGTATLQQLGVSGTNALTFTTLNAMGSIAKQADVNVTVTDALTVDITGGSNFDIQAKILTLKGTSTLTTGSIDVTDGGSTVVYDKFGGSQTILGLSYAGAVTLSNTSTKNIGGAGASVTGAFSHSGGDLTVDQNLTVAYATPSFATIADVSTTKTLTLSGTGAKSITAVATTTGGGAISNTGASGLLTIATLAASNGVISGGAGGVTFTNVTTHAGTITGGSGPVTFTNAAANSGTITGGLGKITFGGTLAHSGGTITAGDGDIDFNGVVTRTGGSIASSDVANVLNFATAVNGTAGTIDLTGTGAAEFGGAVASTNGLSFATGTTVTYDQASPGQAIADVNYGYLTLKSGTKTWTLGAERTINNTLDVQASSATTISGASNLNVTGNIALASDVTKSDNAVVFANATSAVSGNNEIKGSVTRTITLAQAYTFNNAAMVMTPTTVGDLSTFTIKSEPGAGASVTNYNLGNTINRMYTPTHNGTTATFNLQLSYLGSEINGATEGKLKQFANGSIISGNKIAGVYSRTPAGTFGSVSLAGLTSASFTSGQAIALDDRYSSFASILAGNWDNASTWSDGLVPTSSDPVVIASAYGVTIPTAVSAVASSVLINNGASGGLTLAGTATLTVSGSLTNDNVLGAGLTLNTSSNTVEINGDLTNIGKVVNAGTITVK